MTDGPSSDSHPHLCSCKLWLEKLLAGSNVLRLLVCRYHNRTGAFEGRHEMLSQHLVTFVEQGCLSAVIGGKSYSVGAGELLWVPPGRLCRYFGLADTPPTRQYNLRFVLMKKQREFSFLREELHLRDTWAVQAVFQQLHDLHLHRHTHAEARLRALLVMLSSAVMGLMESEPTGKRLLTPGQRQRLDRFMVDHVAVKVLPSDLAGEAGLSHDYFSRLFHNTYGASPRVYLKQERMRMAAIRLLETSLTVQQVSLEFGIENLGLFCRQFRATMGCTPTEYRKRGAPSGLSH